MNNLSKIKIENEIYNLNKRMKVINNKKSKNYFFCYKRMKYLNKMLEEKNKNDKLIQKNEFNNKIIKIFDDNQEELLKKKTKDKIKEKLKNLKKQNKLEKKINYIDNKIDNLKGDENFNSIIYKLNQQKFKLKDILTNLIGNKYHLDEIIENNKSKLDLIKIENKKKIESFLESDEDDEFNIENINKDEFDIENINNNEKNKSKIIKKRNKESKVDDIIENDIDKKILKINNSIVKNNKNTKILYQILLGGLCNQLFMLFNLIALSVKYNKKFIISYDNEASKKYLKDFKVIRNSFEKYNLFKKIKENRLSDKKTKNFSVYTEKGFKYENILLEDKNYEIKGFYQSYKYFWDYKDEIKKWITIDKNKVISIKRYYNSFKKKILGIHFRLGDYLNSIIQEFHSIIPVNYFKNILDKLDLSKYQIILFSDSPKIAKELLKNLKINYILANQFSNNDEIQFLMLTLTNTRICSNSTFSLMSCYFNEIYNFIPNPRYYIPNKWFGKKNPQDYNMYDLVPKNNLNFILTNVKKCCVIFFHKNIYKLYKKKWINECIYSVLDQKNCSFDIFEINYGNSNVSVFKDIKLDKKKHLHYFFNKDYKTHTEAMVFLLNKCFLEYNYDIVFNTNMDDYYNLYRFQEQLIDIEKNGSYLNSTLWTYIKEDPNDGSFSKTLTYTYRNNDFVWIQYKDLGKQDFKGKIKYNVIKENLRKLNNVINHSAVCFTKEFWLSKDKYGNKLNYRNDKPFEDLSLWYRAVLNDIPVTVVNKDLITYRIHNNSIGSQKIKIEKENLHNKFKTFCKEPDLSDERKGFLIHIDEFNFDIIVNKNEENCFFFFVCT